MILDGWVADAEKLALNLPKDSRVASRTDYLLNEVAGRGTEVDQAFFDQPAPISLARIAISPEDTFLVINKQGLGNSPTVLGRLAARIPGIAFVAHGPNLPSVFALPDYDASKPLGNSTLLLHELEHITEREEGLTNASLGKRERRAYQLNTSILSNLDGTDFDSFVDGWPVTFEADASGQGASISFHDVVCPTPSRETYVYELWQEGGSSQLMLQSIGRMTVLERLAASLPENEIDQLADGLHASSK